MKKAGSRCFCCVCCCIMYAGTAWAVRVLLCGAVRLTDTHTQATERQPATSCSPPHYSSSSSSSTTVRGSAAGEQISNADNTIT